VSWQELYSEIPLNSPAPSLSSFGSCMKVKWKDLASITEMLEL